MPFYLVNYGEILVFSLSIWSALRAEARRLCPELSPRTWCCILTGRDSSSAEPGKQWDDRSGWWGRGVAVQWSAGPWDSPRKACVAATYTVNYLSILGENLKDPSARALRSHVDTQVRLGKRGKPSSLMPGHPTLLYLLPPHISTPPLRVGTGKLPVPPAQRLSSWGAVAGTETVSACCPQHPREMQSEVFETSCLWDASANPSLRPFALPSHPRLSSCFTCTRPWSS